MVWENGETRFHCVENFADFADFARAIFPSAPTGTKPGSRAWMFLPGKEKRRLPRGGGRGTVRADGRRAGGKAGGKQASNVWKSPRKWLPMLGKTGETGFQWLDKIRAIFSLDIG